MKIVRLLLSIFSFLTIACMMQAQEGEYILQESLTDARIVVNPAERETQQSFSFSSSSSYTVQVNTDSDGNDILSDAANEPSLAIDPNDPSRMVIGWRQFDTIGSSFRQAGIAYSDNGGNTWNVLEPLEAGVFRSDPVLAADNFGRFYYNSLAISPFRCNVFTSTDMVNWSDTISAQGGDKQWMAIDNNIGSSGTIYSNWSAAYSICDGNFTRSAQDNLSFDECFLMQPELFWGSIAVGPDGAVYEIGNIGGAIVVNRMLANDFNTDVIVDVTSTVDLNGQIAFGSAQAAGAPNPQGLLGQAWVAVDHSDTERKGSVYTLATTVNGADEKSNIYFNRSEDDGQTWVKKVLISGGDSVARWDWMGTMSVAPNGRVDVFWLDGRDSPIANFQSLYYTYSLDGGDNWADHERLSQSFNPFLGFPLQRKMGDYFHSVSMNDTAYLAWAGTFTGGQDVYFTKVAPNFPVAVDHVSAASSPFRVYPTLLTSNRELYVQSEHDVEVELQATDLSGRLILERSMRLQQGINYLEGMANQFSGTVLLTITSAQGERITHRIISIK